MIGIVVTGHGNFATGLTSSVKLIAGMPECYQTVDFVQENSVDDLEANINEAISYFKNPNNAGLKTKLENKLKLI